MRVFLTGASGFLGSFVCRHAVESGATVAILVRSERALRRVQPVLDRLQVILGDLDDESTYGPSLVAFRPDVVVHLAWDGVAGADRNDERQLANVSAATALLRWTLRAGAFAWIGLGSQAEYGPSNQRLSETMPTVPTTLYGAAKLATAVLAECYCAQAGLRFAWLRVFSTYGPMDHSSWMIPYLIGSLLRGERPSLTEGTQRWDYLYVADAADAIWRVASDANATGIFNLGSGSSTPLRTIIEKVRDYIDPSLPLGFGEVPFRPDQVMQLEADITRLRTSVGWTPFTPLDEGLRRTVEWYREHQRVSSG